MVINHFLKWIATAKVQERAAAAAALARAYVDRELDFEDRCGAEAALTLLLDDPSAKVRHAMAEALSMSRNAPLQVVRALASDQPEIAGMIIGRSPLLTEADMVDLVATSHASVQQHIAARPHVTMAVSAALAEIGEAAACVELLRNETAAIASLSFRRMAERFGSIAAVRAALIADARLPADCRHEMLVRVGEALQASPLVVALMGTARAQRMTRDACAKSSLTLIDGTPTGEHAALVEHLRLRGDLTAAFVVRTVAHGKIDFFGSVLVGLAAQSSQRVMALLASGGEGAVSALLTRAGLDKILHRVILCALKIWREVANGRRTAGPQEVSWLMLKELGGQTASGDLANLIKSIHLDALRQNARGHALAIAAA